MGHINPGGLRMRIITYADPFSLRSDSATWELITSHPHFCASDTLAQGMISYYGRDAFSIIRPLSDLINIYMGSYMDNPVNDMRLYMSVMEEIRSWPSSPLQQAYIFNRTAVVEAIRLIMPLECDTNKIDESLLNEEQRKLFDIYNAVRKKDCYDAFHKLRKKTFIDYEESTRKASAKEMNYRVESNRKDQEFLRKNGITDMSFRDLGDAIRAADLLADNYSEQGKQEQAKDYRAIADACRLKKNSDYYRTVIIHAVHHFTPEIIYLLNDLDKRLKINIVFLIPYASGLPEVYDTWKRVYEWTHAEFENVTAISETHPCQPEAFEIAKTLCGEYPSIDKTRKLLAYDNLTSFSIHEVGKCYRAAKMTAPEGKRILDNMKTQYYAVTGTECNELLKMFYPEQFKTKPFLSYPIGQLILGIYRMWDFERNEMIFNITTLMECAVSGLFQERQNVGETLRKTKLFFRGAETLLDYQQRIQIIQDFRRKEATDSKLSGLKRLSFLDVSLEECIELSGFLDELSKIGCQLFANKTQKQINYIEHFKELMKIITEAANSDNRVLPDTERELVQSIKDQLNTSTSENVEGSIQDVSDALAFFLSSRLEKNSSNWIVRDFEQIDGAVLLSPKSKAQKYHFALLSNEHMLKQSKDELPWPLSVSIFDAYEEIKDSIQAIASSIRERRSFLKFSLFYGTYFSYKAVEFSYVTEERGVEQTPYYLFSAMGYKPEFILPKKPVGFLSALEEREKKATVLPPIDQEGEELFAICPFKYLMKQVLGADIHYSNEFHITYFLRYYLTYLAREKHENNSLTAVRHALEDIRAYFPFLGPTVLEDLVRDSTADLEKYKTYNATVHRRKLNFLIARWQTEDYTAQFTLTNPNKAIANYLRGNDIYPMQKQLPRYGICDYCNYQGICLRDFYESHKQEEDEM